MSHSKHENIYKTLGTITDQEDQDYKKELQKEAHNSIDPLWKCARLVFNNNEDQVQHFRSDLYRLIAFVNDDIEGMRDPRQGAETHMSSMGIDKMPNVSKIVKFLLKDKEQKLTNIVNKVRTLSMEIEAYIKYNDSNEEQIPKPKLNLLKKLEPLTDFVKSRPQNPEEQAVFHGNENKQKPKKNKNKNKKKKGHKNQIVKDEEYYILNLAKINAELDIETKSESQSQIVLKQLRSQKAELLEEACGSYVDTFKKELITGLILSHNTTLSTLSKINKLLIKSGVEHDREFLETKLHYLELTEKNVYNLPDKYTKDHKKDFETLKKEKTSILEELEKRHGQPYKLRVKIKILSDKIDSDVVSRNRDGAIRKYKDMSNLIVRPNEDIFSYLDPSSLLMFLNTADKLSNIVSVTDDLKFIEDKLSQDPNRKITLLHGDGEINLFDFVSFGISKASRSFTFYDDLSSKDPKEINEEIQNRLGRIDSILTGSKEKQGRENLPPICCFKETHIEMNLEHIILMFATGDQFNAMNGVSNLVKYLNSLHRDSVEIKELNNNLLSSIGQKDKYSVRSDNLVRELRDKPDGFKNFEFKDTKLCYSKLSSLLNQGLTKNELEDLSNSFEDPNNGFKLLCQGAIDAKNGNYLFATINILTAINEDYLRRPNLLEAIENSLLYSIYYISPETIRICGRHEQSNCLFKFDDFPAEKEEEIIQLYVDSLTEYIGEENLKYFPRLPYIKEAKFALNDFKERKGIESSKIAPMVSRTFANRYRDSNQVPIFDLNLPHRGLPESNDEPKTFIYNPELEKLLAKSQADISPLNMKIQFIGT